MEKPSKETIRGVLSVLMILMMIGLFILIFTVELPENNKEMAYLLVGAVSGSFTTIISFWYGSSQGSADKQDKLNELHN